MHEFTIAAIAKNLRKKIYSAEEFTKDIFQRVRKQDKDLNSFITTTEDKALIAARAADQLLRTETATPLTGIPVAYKDNFYTKDIKTTCASKLLQNHYPNFDATVVAKLADAGTIICGKTNMDEFAMGSSNETSFFGRTKNPWNLGCVPGGSSGGSAAAVAAKLIPFALGTDTGGSTRQPAAFCGVCGLKPTFGLVSKHGIVPFSTSLDHVGIFAHTAEDLALVLAKISGFDSQDPTSVTAKLPLDLTNSLNGLKIGLPQEYFQVTIDTAIACTIEKAITVLEKHGAKIKEVTLPRSEVAVPTYCTIADAECTSNLKNIGEHDIVTRSQQLGSEVKRRMLAGAFLQTEANSYLTQAQKIRRLIYNDFQKVFQDVDIILGPTTPTVAFKAGTTCDPIKMYFSDMFTVAASLAGLPALSLPIGFTNSLPIGMQLISNHFTESLLLSVAHNYQYHCCSGF